MEGIEYDIDTIDAAAQMLLQRLGSAKKVAIYGAMGAGKTTLVRALCQVLGIRENVSSPTFAIVNEYSLQNSQSLVYHFDLYRLKSLQEIIDIDVENYLGDDNYCFVEWPELLEPLLPPDAVRIKLEFIDSSRRKILLL